MVIGNLDPGQVRTTQAYTRAYSVLSLSEIFVNIFFIVNIFVH